MELKIGNNLYMLAGQLGRDPEQKMTQSGKTLTTFSVAIGKQAVNGNPDQTETVWRNIACWSRLAESATKLHKGDTVLVFGEMSKRDYVDREGNQKVSETINAEAFFVTPSAYGYGNSYSAQQNAPQQQSYGAPATNYPPQNAMPFGQPQQHFGQQPHYAHQPGYGQQQPQQNGFVPFESKEDLPFD